MKGNCRLAQQLNFSPLPDVCHPFVNRRRIDRLWLLTRQPQQHSAVGSVTVPCECQRAKQLYSHARNTPKQPSLFQLRRKPARRPHRSHRMRTRWPHSNLENLKNAGLHNSSCRANPCEILVETERLRPVDLHIKCLRCRKAVGKLLMLPSFSPHDQRPNEAWLCQTY